MTSIKYNPENYNYVNSIEEYSRNPSSKSNKKYNYSIVCCARWESEYIVEWINYHLSIGFDHIYIYSNDDNPEDIYKNIIPFISGENPSVTFKHYSFIGLQFQMYFNFLWNYGNESEYIIFLDVDEFICLKKDKNIESFMENFLDYDAVYFNWCTFGNNYFVTRPNGSVLTNYNKRESNISFLTKVLIKSSKIPYRDFYLNPNAQVNHDYFLLSDNIKACNVLKEDMRLYYKMDKDGCDNFIYDFHRNKSILNYAFVAHFSIKSEEDFSRRYERSISGPFKSQAIWKNLSSDDKKNFIDKTNSVEDNYLKKYWSNFLEKSWEHSIFRPSKWKNISQDKQATQISTAHNCDENTDATKVLSGFICGGSQNHTKEEDYPWWILNLNKNYIVNEIRIFNRLDGAMERIANFILEGSTEQGEWFKIFKKNDDLIFGGADGNPFTWTDNDGVVCSQIRITILREKTYLHFDQIEVYGSCL